MNIKGFTSPPVALDQSKSVESKIRTQPIMASSSSDRDADGRRYDDHDEGKKSFSDEDLLQLLNFLKQIKGVKDCNLRVSIKNNLFIISEFNGNVVQKFSAQQAWYMMTHNKPENSKGALLDKAG